MISPQKTEDSSYRFVSDTLAENGCVFWALRAQQKGVFGQSSFPSWSSTLPALILCVAHGRTRSFGIYTLSLRLNETDCFFSLICFFTQRRLQRRLLSWRSDLRQHSPTIPDLSAGCGAFDRLKPQLSSVDPHRGEPGGEGPRSKETVISPV